MFTNAHNCALVLKPSLHLQFGTYIYIENLVKHIQHISATHTCLMIYIYIFFNSGKYRKIPESQCAPDSLLPLITPWG